MKPLFTITMSLLVLATNSLLAANTAFDSAVDTAYNSGWTTGLNGGSGFGAWQLSAGGSGGHFVGSSTNNAGGSGGVDTSSKSWGMWAASNVTAAIRPFTGTLTAGQVFSVAFDNGWLESGKSVGIALQNAAGNNLWEFYFNGGDGYYTINDANGSGGAPIGYTGDGLVMEFELLDGSNCLARATDSTGKPHDFLGRLLAQADQGITRVRFWNWEAGSGSAYDLFINSLAIRNGHLEVVTRTLTYPVVDTGQDVCYNDSTSITAPVPGTSFAGQDAQYNGNQPRYTLSADGLSVYDNNTGLTWQQTPDIDDDGDIDVDDKLTWAELQTYPAALNAGNFGGYSNWRLPSIKDLYSLIDFRGTDPNVEATDTTGLVPFIDTDYFEFAYGDTGAGERVIDSQYASSNLYVAGNLLFGVNFADGRIKGYGLTAMGGGDKTFLVMCCRGNTDYGKNTFVDNGNGTITDNATGLTWQQLDSVVGMNWEDALAYAENMELGGYRDWRLPNAKELQSLLDYSRSPGTSSSAAIDPLFSCSTITNLANQLDYPFYWSSTTHLNFMGIADRGCYVAFGRGLGQINGNIVDIHGAGCQRSDPKDGNPANYPVAGMGPQGDVQRVFNHVRCVRGAITDPVTDTDNDGLSDWYEYNYVTNTTAMSAYGDIDGDDYDNLSECGAGTSPIDDGSYLAIEGNIQFNSSGAVISWPSVADKAYKIERGADITAGGFSTVIESDISATPPMNTYTDATATAGCALYRISVK